MTDPDPIEAELRRIEEAAMLSAQSQFEQAKFWRAVNLLLGAPASVLAAIAGATILAATTNHLVAGSLALAAAGLGALMTTLGAGHRSAQAHASANQYLALQTDARILRTVDLPHLSRDEARAQLAQLTARRDEINQSADIPSFWAYWRGAANIKKGRQSYEVDRPRG